MSDESLEKLAHLSARRAYEAACAGDLDRAMTLYRRAHDAMTAVLDKPVVVSCQGGDVSSVHTNGGE